MSCAVVRRCGSDLALMWLWHRPAATAPIRPLPWEPPCAMGEALKRQNKQTNKTPNKQKSSMISFYQMYKEHILLKLFQKIEGDGTLPNSIYNGPVTLIPKPKALPKKKKKFFLWRPVSFMTIHAKYSKTICKPNLTIYKKDHTPWLSWIYSRDAQIVQIFTINVIDHIN